MLGKQRKTLPGSQPAGCSPATSIPGWWGTGMLLQPFYKSLERKIKASVSRINPGWCCLHPPHNPKVPLGGTGHPPAWIRSPANHEEINKPQWIIQLSTSAKHPLPQPLASQGRSGLGRALNKIPLAFRVFYRRTLK